MKSRRYAFVDFVRRVLGGIGVKLDGESVATSGQIFQTIAFAVEATSQLMATVLN